VGREEVRSYGGELLDGRAVAVRRDEQGAFRVELGGGHALVARRVLAATGLVDVLPDIDGLAEHWGRDVIHCPFCHGFEVRDQRVVQILSHPMGLHPTPLLRHLTDRLTIVLHDADGVDRTALEPFVAAGVEVLDVPARRVNAAGDGPLTGVELADGRVVEADAVLVGPRFRVRSAIFEPLGQTTTAHASGLGDVIEVDALGQTAVAGLYAAGNVTDPGLQVLHAAAQGSRVGAMIAFSLADEDLAASGRSSGHEADWDHRYSGDEHMWSGNPNGTLVAEVADLVPGRALDVGAGEGGDAIWLAEGGWKVTASDISSRSLARVAGAARQRDAEVECLHVDANAPGAFETSAFDLVSMQYGAMHRTPDLRGLRNLLDAVAPGGTLLVVAHDLTPMREPIDVETQTRMFDPDAYLGVDEIADVLARSADWTIEVHETRPRPSGAASAHHVEDVVLRARKLGA
jgi:thioredoxin reductase/SAM-dependent methyltransferase